MAAGAPAWGSCPSWAHRAYRLGSAGRLPSWAPVASRCGKGQVPGDHQTWAWSPRASPGLAAGSPCSPSRSVRYLRPWEAMPQERPASPGPLGYLATHQARCQRLAGSPGLDFRPTKATVNLSHPTRRWYQRAQRTVRWSPRIPTHPPTLRAPCLPRAPLCSWVPAQPWDHRDKDLCHPRPLLITASL